MFNSAREGKGFKLLLLPLKGRWEVTPSKVSKKAKKGYAWARCGSPEFIPEICHVDLASTPTTLRSKLSYEVEDYE
jgi:hypothetical protein